MTMLPPEKPCSLFPSGPPRKICYTNPPGNGVYPGVKAVISDQWVSNQAVVVGLAWADY